MKSLITHKTDVRLRLDYNEAMWLKKVVQNPVLGSLEDENPKDNMIRESFWNTLKQIK